MRRQPSWSRRGSLRVLAPVLALALFLGSCSSTPRLYLMSPAELEAVRGRAPTIGVVTSEVRPDAQILRPARGVAGGAWRGLVNGFALPIVGGLVSPIPGGVFLGLLISPLTAVVGALYGSTQGTPGEVVDEAEAVIEEVTAEYAGSDIPGIMASWVLQLGAERTDHEFHVLDEVRLVSAGQEPAYEDLDLDVAAVLELHVEGLGLRGLYTLDPSMETFVRLRARLVSTEDGAVLLEETYSSSSDHEQKFLVWSGNGGEALKAELRQAAAELAEKVVDDFFLFYPLPR